MSKRRSASHDGRPAHRHPTNPKQKAEVLSIRIDRNNRNHHLWNNNGTWWCHYTVHTPQWQKRRVRVSLHTRCVEKARARRDQLIERLTRLEKEEI